MAVDTANTEFDVDDNMSDSCHPARTSLSSTILDHPQLPALTSLTTSLTLATDATTHQPTSEDLSGAIRTEKMAKFTDLPMELLIIIAKILFAEYRSTRPADTGGAWWDIQFPDGDIDMSFFAARRVSQAMRDASRNVFFEDLDLAAPWLKKGTRAMDRRINLEAKYAHGVMLLQHDQKWPCQSCRVEKCLSKRWADCSDKARYWTNKQLGTRQNLVNVHRDYTFLTSDDLEMLFNEGFCLGREMKLNRRGDPYTALYLIRVRDGKGNVIEGIRVDTSS